MLLVLFGLLVVAALNVLAGVGVLLYWSPIILSPIIFDPRGMK
jgi:hypothetical protein